MLPEATEAAADREHGRPVSAATLSLGAADELIQAIQAKAQARLNEAKAGPLPDEPNFNEETMRALRDAKEGKGLVRYDNWDDLFADLGM